MLVGGWHGAEFPRARSRPRPEAHPERARGEEDGVRHQAGGRGARRAPATSNRSPYSSTRAST
ncbi:hypothetical protein E9565_10980 [Blastococcus sp. KM273129]|nr:hypothetical protein [Blastococcus sp. KM273129]